MGSFVDHPLSFYMFRLECSGLECFTLTSFNIGISSDPDSVVVPSGVDSEASAMMQATSRGRIWWSHYCSHFRTTSILPRTTVHAPIARRTAFPSSMSQRTQLRE